jgi:hypothetical protein
MKRLIYVACILALMGTWSIAGAVEQSDFRLKASLKADEKIGMPVRLALPRAVITETSRGFSDLRLFDDQGTEIPYVIYAQRGSTPTTQSFTWKVIDYQNIEGTQTIFLEGPAGNGFIRNLNINTKERDFNKSCKVYASTDRTFWQLIAHDSCFDFSSQIDLRKTTLKLPPTKARYLRVILKDNDKPIDRGEDIRLRYKDLEFTLSGLKTGEIKIDGFTSTLEGTKHEAPLFDHAVFTKPHTFLDKQKNTIVSLGRVNLPIEKASLKIKNTYYYRSIELWVAATDDEQSYQRVAQDVVYKIPGISSEKNTITYNQSQHAYVRLKVINHDNPPLQVEEVTIEWIRRNLYFIPEASRRYTLYCGGENIPTPRYELQKLVPDQHEQLMRYDEWKIGDLQKNEDYSPKPATPSQKPFERYLLTVLVILLVCGLAWWAFRLMKNIPGSKSQ